MEAAAVLDRLKQFGFQFLALPRYERYVATERKGFAALLEYTPEGEIRQFSAPGYLLDGQLALLVEREGQSLFVSKDRQVRADAALLEHYHRFQRDLRAALGASS